MNVDRIATAYRWIEYAAFGHALEQCRFAFVDRLASSDRILIIGEGDGRFLERLVATNRNARIDVVELSARMVELARERLRAGDRERVSFRLGDVRRMSLPAGAYAAVVTNFVLDCFSDKEARTVVDNLRCSLRTDGVWVVSEFQQLREGWKRIWAAAWLIVMYTFFRLTTGLETRRLPDYPEFLRQSGMVLMEERRAWFGLMSSQIWRSRQEVSA